MQKEKVIDYLNIKYSDSTIELLNIERKYSLQYGNEHYIYFKKNGVTHKEIMTQHNYATL